MLNQVLHIIESTQGALSLNDLSRTLDIERSALDGMIQFWVQKGRLRDDDADLVIATTTCSSPSCGESCTDMAACPFVAKLPKTYSVRSVQSIHPGEVE